MFVSRQALAVLAVGTIFAHASACSSSSSSNGGGVSGYCSKVTSYAKECGEDDPCTQAVIADCTTIAGAFSNAYLAAANMCMSSASCADGGGVMPENCLNAQLSSASPSAAQEQVKTDFCKECPDNSSTLYGAACTQFFAGSDGASGGIGDTVLAYSDAIANKIDQQCTAATADSGALDCVSSFLICSEMVVEANTTVPSACQKGGGTTTPTGTDGG